jgi:putative peptidoglycan lipid II flippase
VQFKGRFLTVAASAMGVTLLVQVLAFLRQLLIAAYFGVGRNFDVYVMVYTVATVMVFTFAGIFDSVTVPHLVRKRESEGLEAALALARSLFRLSLVLGGGMSLAFLIAVPLLAPIFATGFSPEERSNLARLVWYFLPWTFLCLPYYAATARHKMEWRFNRVFTAEIVIVAVSIGFLVFWHGDIHLLPIAYATGYGAGLVQLAAGAALLRRDENEPRPSARGVLRNIGELFLANQTGGLVQLLDRHFQSFLAAGGIGAVNYSGQITASLSSLLAFRDIYVVPLTQHADRAERLERLLSGLLLMSIPFAGLVACLAPDLVTALLQRGRFDAAATALTAEVLRIGALSLVPQAVIGPLARIFQIIDRIHNTHVLYLAMAASTVVSGYLFVIMLGWGVQGVASMQLTGSVIAAIVTSYLIHRCGIQVRWRPILGLLLLALVVAGIAYLAATVAISQLENTWLRLAVGGSAYGFVVLLCYFSARAQLRGILFGKTPSGGSPRELA